VFQYRFFEPYEDSEQEGKSDYWKKSAEQASGIPEAESMVLPPEEDFKARLSLWPYLR
jgi:hypothetical protein